MTPEESSPFPTGEVSPAPRAGLESTLERIAQELLRQRRTERRWRVFFRLAWLGLALAVAVVVLMHRSSPSTTGGPHTAMVEIRGEIAAESDASAEALVGALKSAFEDASAPAVVLRINSPGGSPVQAGIVYDEIKRLKAKHGKKVYAVVEEMCASGAYYIAVAADEIYVDKASIVGSIGVLMDGFGFTGLMAKLGVERRLLTAGENKAMLDPFSELKPRPSLTTAMNWRWICSIIARANFSWRGLSSLKGSSMALFSPAVSRRRSTPSLAIRPVKPKPSINTPMLPTMLALST